MIDYKIVSCSRLEANRHPVPAAASTSLICTICIRFPDFWVV